MSAYILARVTPHTRRLSDVETRLRTIIGVMSQKGATNSRLFRILMNFSKLIKSNIIYLIPCISLQSFEFGHIYSFRL